MIIEEVSLNKLRSSGLLPHSSLDTTSPTGYVIYVPQIEELHNVTSSLLFSLVNPENDSIFVNNKSISLLKRRTTS